MNFSISKNRCTPGYEITAKNNSVIRVKYFPIDLSQNNNGKIEAFKGLERVFNKRQRQFLKDLSCMAQLAKQEGLCNHVQCYRISSEEKKTFGESTFYAGVSLSELPTLEDILLSISGIGLTMASIEDHVGSADVRLEDIICEGRHTGAVHFLYISTVDRQSRLALNMARTLLEKLKGNTVQPWELIIFEKIVWSYNTHPLARQNIVRLLKILTGNPKKTDWNETSHLSLKIKSIIDADYEYFLNPASSLPSCLCRHADLIEEAFKSADAVVLYPENDIAIREAKAYIDYSGERYTHIACCHAENGLRNGFLSDDLALSKGEVSFSDRLLAIKKLCEEPTLIILDGFSEEDTDFGAIAELPAQLLIISKNDLSDYGLISINVLGG